MSTPRSALFHAAAAGHCGALTCVAAADTSRGLASLPSFAGVTPLMAACARGDTKALACSRLLPTTHHCSSRVPFSHVLWNSAAIFIKNE